MTGITKKGKKKKPVERGSESLTITGAVLSDSPRKKYCEVTKDGGDEKDAVCNDKSRTHVRVHVLHSLKPEFDQMHQYGVPATISKFVQSAVFRVSTRMDKVEIITTQTSSYACTLLTATYGSSTSLKKSAKSCFGDILFCRVFHRSAAWRFFAYALLTMVTRGFIVRIVDCELYRGCSVCVFV